MHCSVYPCPTFKFRYRGIDATSVNKFKKELNCVNMFVREKFFLNTISFKHITMMFWPVNIFQNYVNGLKSIKCFHVFVLRSVGQKKQIQY